jgi:hypothetical protein
MTIEAIAAIRKKCWHYLTPEVAAAAGLTLAQLQRFIAHQHTPTDDQLRALALRMGVETTP